jgi:hypothetical protein
VGYVGHQCAFPDAWTDPALFYWQLAFPFLAVALCSLWWLLKAGLARLPCSRYYAARAAAQDREVRVIKNKQTLASMFHTPERLADYVWIRCLVFLP